MSILVASAGFSGTFRVLARGYEASAGLLTVAGEVLPDRWSAAL